MGQPTDDDSDEFCKTELEPMLRDVPAMERVFPRHVAKHKDNTLRQKKFLGCFLHLRGGKAAKNFRRLSIDVAYLDELDGFDPDIEKEGSSVMLSAKRVEGATFPKHILGSTPKLKYLSLIEARVQHAHLRFQYHVPCPHCQHEHPLTWGGREAAHGMKWTGRDPESAAQLCPACGSLYRQADYLRVWERGRWIADGARHWIDPDGRLRTEEGAVIAWPEHVAFHNLWTAYSPVTTHALWFDNRADLILVPTENARQRALKYKMPPEKGCVVGLPVADKYCIPRGRKSTLRKKLGWTVDKPVVLLVGGGEGMGPLAKTAFEIDASGLDLSLVIVCGRNQKLKATLEAYKWENPAFIYGFTREMPDFMRAADFIVTKAGPGTVAEALNAELPIILYSKLTGQEDGNVTFVQEEGAGVWAPTPQEVVRALTRWISRPDEKQKVIENCRRAGRPEAARIIARTIGKMLGL